jgi:tight adherence protein C
MPDFGNPGNIGLLVVGGALAAGVLVAAIASLVNERISLRAKLRQIDDLYDLVDLRDQQLMLPFVDRILSPLRSVLGKLGRRLSPGGYLNGLQASMARAGRLDAAAADRFLAVRVLTLVFAPVAFWLARRYIPLPAFAKLPVGVLAAVAVVMLPQARLKRTVNERETLIRKQFPDILDLLVVCVEAGLGFSSGLSRTVASVPGELADEFGVALGEMRAGSNRADALQNLAERVQIPEMRSFVTALRQADKFGVPIATVLRAQAEDMRIRRRQLAQEKAMKAPVKMLIPMVFCIFPPLFIIVIGPAGLQLTQAGLS